jgi:hypothetical protein
VGFWGRLNFPGGIQFFRFFKIFHFFQYQDSFF